MTMLDRILETKRAEVAARKATTSLSDIDAGIAWATANGGDPARLAMSSLLGDVEIQVDPSQLRQIVWNLCENAVKYGAGEDGANVIELRVGRLASTARPFLEVADRGPGIPPQHRERIFEPFFTGNERGTGLGLFLARELAQTNGATLLYEPRTSGGSLFRIVFRDPERWVA